MAKASKPIAAAKGHRTKAEIQYREEAEKSVLSGIEIRELADTAKDRIAHIEFLRVVSYFAGMGKADAVYELPINRYAQMRSREEALKKRIKACKKNYEEADKLYQKLDVLQDRILKLEHDLLLTPAAALRALPKNPPETKPEDTLKEILEL